MLALTPSPSDRNDMHTSSMTDALTEHCQHTKAFFFFFRCFAVVQKSRTSGNQCYLNRRLRVRWRLPRNKPARLTRRVCLSTTTSVTFIFLCNADAKRNETVEREI